LGDEAVTTAEGSAAAPLRAAVRGGAGGVPCSRGRAGQGRGDAALPRRRSAPAGRTSWSGRVHALARGSLGGKPRGGRRAAARPLAPASVGAACRARRRPLLPAARAPDGPGARARLIGRPWRGSHVNLPVLRPSRDDPRIG